MDIQTTLKELDEAFTLANNSKHKWQETQTDLTLSYLLSDLLKLLHLQRQVFQFQQTSLTNLHHNINGLWKEVNDLSSLVRLAPVSFEARKFQETIEQEKSTTSRTTESPITGLPSAAGVDSTHHHDSTSSQSDPRDTDSGLAVAEWKSVVESLEGVLQLFDSIRAQVADHLFSTRQSLYSSTSAENLAGGSVELSHGKYEGNPMNEF